jgi:hypothetical protein
MPGQGTIFQVHIPLLPPPKPPAPTAGAVAAAVEAEPGVVRNEPPVLKS